MRQNQNGHQQNCGNGSGPGKEPPRKRVPEELAAQVRRIAYHALPPRARTTTNLYLDPWMVTQGAALGPSFESLRVRRDSVLCFADYEPLANFSHPCGYFLHDAGTGELLRRAPAQFPPYPLLGLNSLDLFHEAVKPVETHPKHEREQSERRLEKRMDRALSEARPSGRRYAILFAGVSDPHHLNDLELCLRMLTDTFGFARSDIFVLFSDGTTLSAPFLNKQHQPRTWPGATAAPDNQFRLVPNGKGSRKAFKAVLASLNLQPGDLLYIHTEGHGGVQYGTGGGQYLYCISEGLGSTARYFDFQMEADLKDVQGYGSLLVVMNQCFSGGFSQSVIDGSQADRTFFAAACADNKLAYATTDLKWNRFARNWIEREKLKDADGKVDAQEAYDYCDADGVRGPDTPLNARMPAPGANDHSPADEIVLR